MSLLFLTAVRISPARQYLTTPKVVVLESSQIVKPKAYRGGATVLYGASLRPYKKYVVSESLSQIDLSLAVGAGQTLSLNPYAQDANLGVVPAGSTQAAASAVSTYLTVVTGGAASINSVKLPAAAGFYFASPTIADCRVIINASSVPISVFPATNEYINKSGASAGAGASNVAVSIAAGGRMHFLAAATDNWRVATETGE